MATADEILATMAEEVAATDQMAEVCTIDRCTRAVTIPEAVRIVGVETDKDVTRRVFRVLCSYRGTNLSTFRIRIHFMNANKEKDIYYVTDAAQDGEYLTFSWVISRNATKYKGKLQFIACMVCDGGTDEEREWNSTLGEFTVLEGLEVELTDGEEEQARDAITQLLAVIDARESEAVEAVAAQGTAQVERVKAAGAAQETAIEAKGAATLKTIPDDYATLHNNVATLTEEIERNTAPAIIPTATGRIVTITDGAARPAAEVISHIEPVQSGSGDPSPNNKRPFVSMDNVELNIANNNLLGGMRLAETLRDKASATIDTAAGTVAYWAGSMSASPGLISPNAIKADTRYTIILYGMNTNANQPHANIGVSYTDGSYEPVTFQDGSKNSYAVYVTRADKTPRNIFGLNAADRTTLYYDKCGIFEGVVSAEALIPYDGKRYVATFGQSIYGGDMHWHTGKLYNRYHKIVFDGVTKGAKVDTTDPGNWTYAYIYPGSMPKTLKWNTTAYANKIKSVSTNTVIAFGLPTELTGVTSTDDTATVVAKYNAVLKQWYDAGTPLEIVYEFATPEEIQLSPQQLSTLKGTNNVWSDCGDTTIAYVADTKLYIDQKLAAIAAATL